MEQRHGVPGTTLDDIFFTERGIPSSAVIKHLTVEISRQNSNLTQVKRELAAQVRACGGNVLANFRYGQKKHNWWDYFAFKWDTESWHGEGDALRV